MLGATKALLGRRIRVQRLVARYRHGQRLPLPRQASRRVLLKSDKCLTEDIIGSDRTSFEKLRACQAASTARPEERLLDRAVHDVGDPVEALPILRQRMLGVEEYAGNRFHHLIVANRIKSESRVGVFATPMDSDIGDDQAEMEPQMAKQPTNVKPIRRRIPFTIDGQPYTTDDLTQRASALLRLAGLDPATFDLGELVGKEHPRTKRFADEELVEIVKDARFISIRQSAQVA